MPKVKPKEIEKQKKVDPAIPYGRQGDRGADARAKVKQVEEDAKLQTETTPYGPVFQHNLQDGVVSLWMCTSKTPCKTSG